MSEEVEQEFLSLQELGLDGTLFISDPFTLAKQLIEIMSSAQQDLSGDQTSKDKIKAFTEAAEQNDEATQEAKTVLEAIVALVKDMTPQGSAVLSASLKEIKENLDTVVWSKVLGDNLKIPRAQIHFLHRSAREQYKMLAKFNKSRSAVMGLPEVNLPEIPKGLSGNFKDNGQPFFVVDGIWDPNPYTTCRKLQLEFVDDGQTVSEKLVKFFNENTEYNGHVLDLKEMR